MSPEFVTVEEAATRLRIHVETMRRWVRQGKVSSIKLGKKYLIPSRMLDDLLAAASSGTAGKADPDTPAADLSSVDGELLRQ